MSNDRKALATLTDEQRTTIAKLIIEQRRLVMRDLLLQATCALYSNVVDEELIVDEVARIESGSR